MAASLGQVYKGRLKENGDLVAVKVQRPFVLETVTVDLFVIRNLGLILRKFPQVVIYGRVRNIFILFWVLPTYDVILIFHFLVCLSIVPSLFQISVDVVGLVDEWAARFFEELDYVNEGENGTLFAEMMKKDLPQVLIVLLFMC